RLLIGRRGCWETSTSLRTVSNLVLRCMFRQHLNRDQLHLGIWESLLSLTLDFGCARLIVESFGVHRAKYAVYSHLGMILAGDIHFHLVETPFPCRTASSIPRRTETSSYRRAFKKRRCQIPADGF